MCSFRGENKNFAEIRAASLSCPALTAASCMLVLQHEPACRLPLGREFDKSVLPQGWEGYQHWVDGDSVSTIHCVKPIFKPGILACLCSQDLEKVGDEFIFTIFLPLTGA